MAIPFDQINRSALAAYPSLLYEWFPNGRLCGKEFVIGNINGDRGRSLSINVIDGVWHDFGSDQRGGSDPISLLADINHGGDQGAAARALGAKLGVYLNGTSIPALPSDRVKERVGISKSGDDWQPMVPPPADAPNPSEHILECDTLYEYCDERDRILFYVRRYEGRDSNKKVFLPLTYGRLNGNLGWHAKHPHIPRPLYGLNRLSTKPDATVLLCEGEKAADAAQELFPDYACMSWPGGAGAVQQADLKPLVGRSVIVWPDTDEPGLKAASEIAKLLPKAIVLDVSGLPEAFDAADLAAQGCEDPEGWLQARLPSEPSINPSDDSDQDDEVIRVVKLPPIGRTKIPPRPWAYGTFMLFGHASVIGAVDGGGKGSMAVTIILSIITGKSLLGERVWRKGPVAIITYEDSLDEWHRRIAAGCLLYELDYEYVLDNIIFLTKNRGRIRLAATSRDGIVFPDSAAIIRALKDADARLLIIDPFNHAHDTEDGNNNLVIAKVAGETERIAQEANVSVLALHHLRKGSTGHVDDLMGATSLRATFRSTRILTRMTEEEGKKVGITREFWRYSRIAGTKGNYAPPPDKVVWFELRSVELGNTEVDEMYPSGDQVQVTVTWSPPAMFDGLDRNMLADIFQKIRRGPAEGEHYSPVRKANRWVGNVIIGAGDGVGKNSEQAASIVGVWLKSQLLVEGEYRSPMSRKVEQMVSLDEAKVNEILSLTLDPRDPGDVL